ncbi:uncharacterized protein LOC116338147 isoform X2 [Contarinia nasturtii]|uniref:uncharacterized protein LOC116338147 isoform X2 n=1 Tax=Contarinia nasturtii TaxID=265458 RepID=UPI0012D40264|nr:uncharacterized protein LOC116338147 isoform X2 [Contarinia nasturtii]
MKQPRFSIHDAFEEENDEAIRVYGATVQSISNVPKPSSSGTGNSPTGYTSNNTTSNESSQRIRQWYSTHPTKSYQQYRGGKQLSMKHHHHPELLNMVNFCRNNKFAAEDTTSRDSDSLIQEYINVPQTDLYTHCWNHPKIRENWRTVLAAVCLGIVSIANPANGSRGFVFLLAGSICFIPGAYHVVYIWLAAIGYRGYNFYHLPLFT